MPRYRIVESVGSRQDPVTNWDQIEHHHPSDRLHEDGRVYANVDGHPEEVANNYNGTAVYTPGGQLMVSKDMILLNADNGGGNVPVPSPANGFIGEVDRRNGFVTILDRPGGEVMFRLRHMDVGDDIRPGTQVEYGQPLGIQGGYGGGNPNRFGTHLHIDANVRYLDQADRYVRDMANGTITTDQRPENTTNLVNAVPPIEQISGRFPAPPTQALADGRIELNESGPDVALLQERLRAAGARDSEGREVVQDGDFGERTKQAVEGYQRTQGLPVTGIADRETLERLGVNQARQQPTTSTETPQREEAPKQPASSEPGLLKQSSSGTEVTALQTSLAALGYLGRDGQPLSPDGDFGLNTDHAVRAFQQAHGLQPVDGEVGPITRDALAQAAQRPLVSEATHPNHALYAQIGRQLPAGTEPRVVANVTLQAMENGITSPDKLERVTVLGSDAFVQGNSVDPAMRARVDLQAPTPELQQMSDHMARQTAQAQQREQAQQQSRQQLPQPIAV